MMTATPTMEEMNEQEALQGALDPNFVQEPVQGMCVQTIYFFH